MGHRATNSVSGKTLAEDICSVAGNTTLPSHQGEEDEVDNFASSTCSVAEENTMDTGRGGKPPAEVRTLKRTGNTVIDFSGMKSADKGGPDLEVEELSISSDHSKQDTSDSRTGFEADTAAGKDSHTNSYEDNCFNEMDRHHTNKISNAQTFLDVLHNETDPSPVAMQMACKDLKE